MPQRIRFRTGDQALVREINLSVIMNHVREYAPVSRASLADMTGLNKTTVSSLVSELIERQYVREIGLESVGVGRPAILLELNPGAGCIISAEIGVDFLSVIRTNFAAEIVWRHQKRTSSDMGQRAIMNRMLALLHQAIENCPLCDGSLLGLSVGAPGLIDQETGDLLFAPNLEWENVPLRSILEETFPGIPVFVDNEANMAALGEHYFGVARGHDEVLYISAGVGLGGGIVRSGQLFRGKAGFAGEVGHMTMNPSGERCNCGNRGCWETQVSQSAVFRHIRQAVEQGRETLLTGMVNGNLDRLTVPLIVEAAHAGDRVTLDTLDTVGHHLGIGIASLVNALDPDQVVFGGILSLAGEFLLPAVEAELQERALRWSADPTQVVLAQHGFDACVMGGVAMVYQTILAQPSNAARQGM